MPISNSLPAPSTSTLPEDTATGVADRDALRADRGAVEDRDLARGLIAHRQAAGQGQRRAGAGHRDHAIAAGRGRLVDAGGGDGGALRHRQRP